MIPRIGPFTKHTVGSKMAILRLANVLVAVRSVVILIVLFTSTNVVKRMAVVLLGNFYSVTMGL